MMMQRGLAASGMLLVLGGVVMACDALYLGYRDFPVEATGGAGGMSASGGSDGVGGKSTGTGVGGMGGAMGGCGNGVIDVGEECDDGNPYPGDGCSATCEKEAGYSCETAGMLCTPDPGAQIELFKEKEFNDTIKQAGKNFLITSSAQIAGSLWLSGIDIFKVQFEKRSAVQFETFDVTGADCKDISPNIRLLDDKGNPVPYASDYHSGIKDCASLAWNLIGKAAYYVQLTRTSSGPFIQDYQLEITLFRTGDEIEHDDSIQTSNGLWNNHSVVGAIDSPGDVDYYGLYVPKGKSIRAEIIEEDNTASCDKGDVPTFLKLFDEHGNQLAYDLNSGRGSCSLIDGRVPDDPILHGGAHNLQEGHYFLAVSGADAKATFPYRLTLVIR